MSFTWQYYDLVLLAIVASIGLGTGIGVFTSVSMTLAVGGFGFVAIALVGHALFVNGPVDEVEDLAAEVEPEQVPGVGAVAQMSD